MGSTDQPSRRERARAQTLDEIKCTCLDLMRESGSTDVRLSDVARRMGMTAPALYRYVDGRDALLTELITDGYLALADALSRAASEAGDDPVDQVRALGHAYRCWAREDPQQFSLIFGSPVPGYAAPESGETLVAAKRAMGVLEAVAGRALDAGRLTVPDAAVDPALQECLDEVHGADEQVLDAPGPDLPHAVRVRLLQTWAGLHGFACLEAFGHFEMLSEPARDALFDEYVDGVADALGVTRG